jgi:hypothetical protein
MNPVYFGSLGALALILLFWLLWRLWRGRDRSSIGKALGAVAVDRVENVLVPDGMGGEIHIEHLLLTARGILVLNVKRYEGVIFASDRMDQWSAIGQSGRFTFPNPLSDLYDRVAAVRQIVRDVDVAGFVLFPSTADFSKGRPSDILLPEDLLQDYAKPDRDQTARMIEAFQPPWDKIRQASKPA